MRSELFLITYRAFRIGLSVCLNDLCLTLSILETRLKSLNLGFEATHVRVYPLVLIFHRLHVVPQRAALVSDVVHEVSDRVFR